LVAITGQVGTDQMHIEAHQYLDLVAMFAPVTKWNAQIVRPSNTPEIVRKAFKRSQSEKPGGSHRFAGKHCHGSCWQTLHKDKLNKTYALPKYY